MPFTVLRPYALLFVILSVVYHSNLRPVPSGDSLPASLIPFSILLDGSITLDRFGPYITEQVWYGPGVLRKVDGHWYSTFPIAGPVLVTPLYLPIAFVPWTGRQSPSTLVSIARIAEKVTAVMLAAAAAIFLLFLLRRLTSGRAAWLLTLLFAFGTGNWSTSSQALWQHTFGQLAIIGCLYAVERWSAPGAEARWYWIAGAFAAGALAVRPTNIVLLPAVALALWLRPARLADYLRVFVLPVLAAALITAYNLAVFHRLTGGYPPRLSRSVWDGLLGILVSPGRGLLIYTPVVVFAFAVLAPGARKAREQHRPVVIAAGVFSLLHIALIGAWPVWWGGYCWGPRLLTEILAPLMILMAIGLPAIRAGSLKWAFAGAAIYGCFIQTLGVYYYPKGRWDRLPVSVDAAPARLWNWADNPVIRTAQGGFAWEPYSIVEAAAAGGWPAAEKKLQELGINRY
jgi:hypothetical protein